jgi:hypothetical protein
MLTAFELRRQFGDWWVTYRPWLLLVVAIAAAVYLYRRAASRLGPHDYSANGIAVGEAKQFDNRSLTLILEQLDAALAKLSVVSQSVSQNLGTFQGQRSTDWLQTASFTFGEGGKVPEANDGKKDSSAGGAQVDKPTGDAAAASGTAKGQSPAASLPSSFAPAFAGLAGDALTDQMNLAYQIVNLRILNERALSDRLWGQRARLQVVLGFQVSINPPNFATDCAAVVEVELKVPGGVDPISVIAMIPQEKTYNVATLSSSSDSVDGSVVSALWRAGGSIGRRRSDIFLHRDSDTVAFERNPAWFASAFGVRKLHRFNDRALTMFGWEFRPVLGRRSVSPGARQMLAVVALPMEDAEVADGAPPMLGVRTRTYWRRYDRRRQSSGVRLGLWPLPSGAVTIRSDWYDIPVLRTTDIQESLGPKVDKVDWEDGGGGVAIVLVEGKNFFSGTEVTIGGARYRAGDGNLILKSERAIEIHTTIAALARGDAVLSGRYGASIPLRAKPQGGDLPQDGVNIVGAARIANTREKFSWIDIPLVSATDEPLKAEIFNRTPQPIICIGDAVVPQPCYFSDGEIYGDAGDKGRVIVSCYAPIDILTGAPSVLFKVPFMGANWGPIAPLPDDSVTIVRIGGGALIITGAMPFSDPFPNESPWLAVLDQDYVLGATNLFIKLTETQLKLTVSEDIVARYEKLHLSGGRRSYLLDLPRAAPATASTSLQNSQEPPIVRKGAAAIVDLRGVRLTEVTAVRLGRAKLPYEAYADGSRLRVFLNEREANQTGKFDLLFTTAKDTLKASFYVLDDTSKPAAPGTP